MSEGWHPVDTIRMYQKGDIVEMGGKEFKVEGRSTRQIMLVEMSWWERLVLWFSRKLGRK